jgi:hypothetical protein
MTRRQAGYRFLTAFKHTIPTCQTTRQKRKRQQSEVVESSAGSDCGERLKPLARFLCFRAARVATNYLTPTRSVVMKLLCRTVEGKSDALPSIPVKP